MKKNTVEAVPTKPAITVSNFSEALFASLIEAVSVYPRRRNPYPQSVAECLDDTIKFKPEVNEAMVKFKKSRPWSGTKEEIQVKIRSLCHDLSLAYKIKEPEVVFVKKFSTGACCFTKSDPPVIMMEEESDERYSILTFLHEFGHALGRGEKSTCRWSINLFRKHFPKSYKKLIPVGHLLFRRPVKGKSES
jgi:hypothetical protein